MKKVTVPGDTPEEIATSVALFVERGGGTTQKPGWMYQRLQNLGTTKAGRSKNWTATFRNRTGVNVNYSVNGVGKLLKMLVSH